ncbi:MAG: hypothetical protein J7J94_00410 [Thaumarchaeota archaeon]|nr:hypothetical protein [Nitrososphaerota archaeon]
MRRETVLTAILVILLASAAYPVSAQQAYKRTIEISQYGLVYVHDEVPSTGDTTILKFPRSLVKNLVNYVSPEDPKPELKVENETFSIIVHSKPGETVHLTTTFRNTLLWNPYKQEFFLKLPIYPLVPGLGKEPFTLVVELPSDSSIKNVSPEGLNQTGGTTLNKTFEADLSGNKFEYFSVTFASRFLTPLEISSAKLVLNPFSREADLTLVLNSLGGRALGKITINIPAGSKVLKTADSVGEISNGYDPDRGELTLNLRQSLQPGQRVSLEISFKAPENSQLIEIEDGKIAVKPILPMNTTAWTYYLEVILSDASPKSWSPEPYEIRREYPNTVIMKYRFTHVDPFNVGNMAAEIEFTREFSPIPALPYLFAIAIFALAFTAAVYVKKPARAAAEKKVSKDVLDEAQGLVSAYQIIIDLVRTGKIFEKGKARSLILQARAEARRSGERVRKLAREMRREKPEIEREIAKLEESCRKLERVLEQAWELAYPYLSGTLSRKKFEERLNRYYDDLKKAYGEFADSFEDLREKAA